MVMWNSFTDKLSLRHKQDYSEKNSHKLEKRWAAFFQDYQNQSVSDNLRPFVCIHASLCFMLFNGFKWLLQCFTLLFGHFGCHEITSFCVTILAPLPLVDTIDSIYT